MRRIYWLWASGLLLKGLGATWDVAWHFRTLRDTVSGPHLVNTFGGLLCTLALLHEWRHRDARRTGPLLVVIAGLGIFLAAMPFDQWWHMVFGVDLTTWSPAHLMLFAGTAVAVFGVLLLYVADLAQERPVREAVRAARAPERAMLAFFLIFFAAAVYFPMTYNEYTTVAAVTAREAPHLMDAELVEVALASEDPVFHNTPRWLYPVYGVAMAAFVGTLARAWLGRGWALVALAGIAAERVVADATLGALGWPTAALPLQFAFIGLAIELVWLARAPEVATAVAGGVAGAAVGYAYYVRPLTWGPSVPLDASSAFAGVAASAVAALLALLLLRRGLARVAVVELDMADVRAWVQRTWTSVARR